MQMTTAKIVMYIEGLGWVSRYFDSDGGPTGTPAFLGNVMPGDEKSAKECLGINDKAPTGDEADWVYKWDPDRGFVALVDPENGTWAQMHDVIFASLARHVIPKLGKSPADGREPGVEATLWRRGLTRNDISQEFSVRARRGEKVEIFPNGPDGAPAEGSLEPYAAERYLCGPEEAKERAKRLRAEYGWIWEPEWDAIQV